MSKAANGAKGINRSETVAAVMTRPAVTVRAELSLESLAELFLQRGLSRVPVVDEQGHPIGMVGKTDLVADTAMGAGDEQQGSAGRQGQGAYASEPNVNLTAEPRTVEDVMTRNVVTISAEAAVQAAAKLMVDRNLHGLPVVAPDGRVMGMVSALDITRWVANLK